MIVRFVKKCEITICQDTEDADGINRVFDIGETVNFTVFDHPERLVNGEWIPDTNFANVQFDNGSVAFGISKDWYEEI